MFWSINPFRWIVAAMRTKLAQKFRTQVDAVMRIAKFSSAVMCSDNGLTVVHIFHSQWNMNTNFWQRLRVYLFVRKIVSYCIATQKTLNEFLFRRVTHTQTHTDTSVSCSFVSCFIVIVIALRTISSHSFVCARNFFSKKRKTESLRASGVFVCVCPRVKRRCRQPSVCSQRHQTPESLWYFTQKTWKRQNSNASLHKNHKIFSMNWYLWVFVERRNYYFVVAAAAAWKIWRCTGSTAKMNKTCEIMESTLCAM